MAQETIYEFDAEATKIVRKLACKANVSRATILRRALTLYAYLESEAKDGCIPIELRDSQNIELML